MGRVHRYRNLWMNQLIVPHDGDMAPSRRFLSGIYLACALVVVWVMGFALCLASGPHPVDRLPCRRRPPLDSDGAEGRYRFGSGLHGRLGFQRARPAGFPVDLRAILLHAVMKSQQL